MSCRRSAPEAMRPGTFAVRPAVMSRTTRVEAMTVGPRGSAELGHAPGAVVAPEPPDPTRPAGVPCVCDQAGVQPPPGGKAARGVHERDQPEREQLGRHGVRRAGFEVQRDDRELVDRGVQEGPDRQRAQRRGGEESGRRARPRGSRATP